MPRVVTLKYRAGYYVGRCPNPGPCVAACEEYALNINPPHLQELFANSNTVLASESRQNDKVSRPNREESSGKEKSKWACHAWRAGCVSIRQVHRRGVHSSDWYRFPTGSLPQFPDSFHMAPNHPQ